MCFVNDSKGGRYMDELNGTQRGHISIDPAAEYAEEEEVIEIGTPTTSGGRSEARGRVEEDRYADDEYDGKYSRRGSYDDESSRKRRRKDDDEDPDYSLDDVPPIPIVQKIVIFAVIVLLVVAGWYIFKYHFGIV